MHAAATKFVDIADKVIIAGRLPDMIGDDDPLRKNEKVVITNLLPDKEDITIHSIEEIEGVVKSAGSVFLAGPVGKFEEEGHMLGTKRVFDAVAKADAYKVAGGGDTIVALKLLDLFEKFDWVSVGGGASLEFLTIGTLPGIEALEKSSKQNKS